MMFYCTTSKRKRNSLMQNLLNRLVGRWKAFALMAGVIALGACAPTQTMLPPMLFDNGSVAQTGVDLIPGRTCVDDDISNLVTVSDLGSGRREVDVDAVTTRGTCANIAAAAGALIRPARVNIGGSTATANSDSQVINETTPTPTPTPTMTPG
jgi:hypothetical protein